MSKGVNSTTTETTKGFMKEVFGMGILLISVLLLLCLLTGDLIFYNVGAVIQGFLLGAFGYFSFAVLFYSILLGLRLLIGKAVFPSNVRAVIWVVSIMVLALLAVVETATVYDKEAGISASLTAAFNMGAGGYGGASIGGWLAMLASAPLIALLSPVGVYIVYPLLIVVLAVFLFRENIRAAIEDASEKKAAKVKEPKQKKEKKAKEDDAKPTVSSFGDGAVQTDMFSSSGFALSGEDSATVPRRTAYFGGDFNLKTKKDKNKEDKPISLFGGEFSSRGTGERGVPSNASYSSAYSADANDRKAYVLTPPPFDPERLGQSPISAVNPSATRSNPYDGQGGSSSVYGGQSSTASESSSSAFKGSSTYPYNRSSSYGAQSSEEAPSRGYTSSDRLSGDRLSAGDRLSGGSDRLSSGARSYDSSRTFDRSSPSTADRLGGRSYDPSASRTAEIDGGSNSYGEHSYEAPARGYQSTSRPFSAPDPTPNGYGVSQESTYSGTLGEDYQDIDQTNYDQPQRTNVPTEGLFDRSQEAMGGVSREISRTSRTDTYGGQTPLRSDFDRDSDGDDGVEGDIARPKVYTPTSSIRTPSRTPSYTEPVAEDAADEAEAPTRASRAPRTSRAIERAPATEEKPWAEKAATVEAESEKATEKTVEETKEVDENDGFESIENMPLRYNYKRPPLDLLEDRASDPAQIMAERTRLRELAETVCVNFKHRGVTMTLENIVYGMSASRFEYSIPTTVSVKAITNAQTDLAVWLHTKGDIRILAPIPGTSLIGIEVPNEVVSPVGLKDMLISPALKKMKKDVINIAVGKNIMGDSVFESLTDMPHLLVAGASGTGKSVFLNSLLVSLLYTYSPEDLRLVIVDPKKLEFVDFESIPHLLFNKIITKGEEAAALLNWLVGEMQRRYDLFAAARVKKISEYNEIIDRKTQRKVPYIIVLVDEFAELMMDGANVKKSIDTSITRLAQLARAAGISLIFATQRPSVDVIDGTIKTNFPARVCFKTADQTNSGVVLGEAGAEKLVAKGEMLYRINGPTERAQGAYVDGKEIKRIVSYIKDNNVCYYDKGCLETIKKSMESAREPEEVGQLSMDTGEVSASPASMPVIYRRAVRMVIKLGTTSKSMLQTKLSIGYNKAARIIDWMEKEGFISCAVDNKQRDIKIDRAGYETIFGEPFNEDFLA